MLIKAVILHSHKGILQILRYLGNLHRPTIFSGMDIGYFIAVDIVDLGRSRWLNVAGQIRLGIHAGGEETAANSGYHDQNHDYEA